MAERTARSTSGAFLRPTARSISFKVSLNKGVNKILVRFEAVAMREYSYAMALQVCQPIESDFSGGGEQHLTSPGSRLRFQP